MATLESELRFLYNRVAQIECNTEQRLTDLGRRIHNLTKKTALNPFRFQTVDSMQMVPCCSEPPVNYRRTEESASLKAGEDRYPIRSSSNHHHQHQSCRPHRERHMSSSNNNYTSESGNVAHTSPSLDHRDPCTREVCRIPSSHEAEQLRSSLWEREMHIQHQDRELKERRSQLVTRIKNLTNDVLKAADAGQPPFDKSSPQQPSTPRSPPPKPQLKTPKPQPPLPSQPVPFSPPTPVETHSKHFSSNTSHGPSSSSRYSYYVDGGRSSSYSHSQQPVY